MILFLYLTENGDFCGVITNANPLDFSSVQVVAELCESREVYYVCDDTRRIRYINYYYPNNSQPKTSEAGEGENGAGDGENGAGGGENGAD